MSRPEMPPAPAVMVVTDTDKYGRVFYYPANGLACALLKFARKTVFNDCDLHIMTNDLHYRVIHQNGQPLPFPKAYRKKAECEQRHVLDDA